MADRRKCRQMYAAAGRINAAAILLIYQKHKCSHAKGRVLRTLYGAKENEAFSNHGSNIIKERRIRIFFMNESDMIEFRMQERRGIPTGIEYYLNSIKREGVKDA